MAVEFVGIELQLRGAEGVEHDLKEIDRLLHSLGGKKKVQSGLVDLKREALKAEAEVKRLEKELENLYNLKAQAGDKPTPILDADIDKTLGKYRNAVQRLSELRQATKEVSLEARNMDKTFRQVARSVTSSLSSLGGRVTTLGKTLGRFANPLSNLMRGTVYAAGWKALNMLTEGFGGAFERADVMTNYPRIMKEFGFEADESAAAVRTLEEAVLGLPTGLDEIVAVQKRFAAASQDMEKSTGLAIAFNNAILASGSDARQSWTAQRIFTQLAGGAELATTSWQALQRAIPLAFTELAEQAGMSVGDYVAALSQGDIATEEFMNNFIKLGSEGTIASAARVMTKSWEGFSANLRNATKRMGTAIIDTLHETFKSQTGRDLLDTLLGLDAEGNRTYDGVRDWIDSISKSIQEWIKANPEKIIEFFETLKSIDIKGLLSGIAQGMGDMLKLTEQLVSWLGDKDLSKIGRYYTWLMPISKILIGVGGLIRGLSPILGVGAAAIFKLLGGKGKGIFGALGRIFGKSKDIETAGEAARKVPTVAETFKSAFNALKGLLTAAGAVIIVTGTGAFAFKAVKSIMTDLKSITNLIKQMDWDTAIPAIMGMITGIGFLTELFNAVGGMLGTGGLLNVGIAGLASIFVAGTIDADLALIKNGLQNIVDSIKSLDDVADAIDNMKGLGVLKTKKQDLKDAVASVLEIAEIFGGKNGGPAARGEVTQGIPSINRWQLKRFDNMLEVFKKLPEFAREFDKLNAITINRSIRGKIQDISWAAQTIQTELANLTWMGTSSGSLLKNSTNLAEALKKIRTLARRINSVAGIEIDQGGFSTFVEQIRTAIDSFKELEGDLELDMSVKLAPTFEQSVKDVEKQINDARNKIAQQSNRSIYVTIPVKVTFTVSTNVSEAIGKIAESGASVVNSIPGQLSGTTNLPKSVQPAMGGLIYRARGGGVPFKRRGTDTVPAMLTPGEYVHNKRAVSTFGIDFMRKVNNLDMKGAMSELMHRAGNMANVNRGSVVNNTYNNNQKVVINNSNAGAGFTFRSASRFVGAF